MNKYFISSVLLRAGPGTESNSSIDFMSLDLLTFLQYLCPRCFQNAVLLLSLVKRAVTYDSWLKVVCTDQTLPAGMLPYQLGA